MHIQLEVLVEMDRTPLLALSQPQQEEVEEQVELTALNSAVGMVDQAVVE